jgi:hypothetical protein
MYKYMVMCKVFPKSGFDLVRHNKMIRLMGDSLDNLLGSEEDDQFRNKMKNIFKESFEDNGGYVVEAIPISSVNIVSNPEKDFMPIIRKKYPEAILGKCIALFKTSGLTTELVSA